MSLKQQLVNSLDTIGTYQGDPHSVEVAENQRHLRCELVALDRLACAVNELALQTPELADASIDDLKKLSGTLAGRLTYLLEPIGLVEVEAEQCSVQLRSKPPQREDDTSSYYELLVRRGGQISLCRYTATSGQPRQRSTAQFTREVLGRLVADFEAALDE